MEACPYLYRLYYTDHAEIQAFVPPLPNAQTGEELARSAKAGRLSMAPWPAKLTPKPIDQYVLSDQDAPWHSLDWVRGPQSTVCISPLTPVGRTRQEKTLNYDTTRGRGTLCAQPKKNHNKAKPRERAGRVNQSLCPLQVAGTLKRRTRLSIPPPCAAQPETDWPQTAMRTSGEFALLPRDLRPDRLAPHNNG